MIKEARDKGELKNSTANPIKVEVESHQNKTMRKKDRNMIKTIGKMIALRDRAKL